MGWDTVEWGRVDRIWWYGRVRVDISVVYVFSKVGFCTGNEGYVWLSFVCGVSTEEGTMGSIWEHLHRSGLALGIVLFGIASMYAKKQDLFESSVSIYFLAIGLAVLGNSMALFYVIKLIKRLGK